MIRGLTSVPARATWLAGNFTSAEQTNPAISGDTADPDGDGASNFLEYALGSDPRSSSAPAFDARLTPSSLVLDYPAPHPELRYVAEKSTDLVTWTADGVADSPASGENPGDRRSASVARGENERVFLRLRVAPRQ